MKKQMKLIKTIMMKRYMWRFLLRLLIFLSVFVLYLFNKDLLAQLLKQPIKMGITPIHLLWVYFMGMMILHLFPDQHRSMALRKSRKQQYQAQEGFSELELLRFVQDQNRKAWIVMLIWLCFNAIWGLLYLSNILRDVDLFMLTVFYFLCDYICILIYCPFQSLIMKNRCCVNCRIYDWGHFMMFTPMLFIKDFFSWSLFFTSCVVVIHWEIMYAKYPERFWHGSNQTLQCVNCKDQTCKIKNHIAKKGSS